MKCALSFHQEHLWLIALNEGDADNSARLTDNNIPLLLHGTGRLDHSRVAAAGRILAGRQSALRTRVVGEGDAAVQVIADAVEIECEDVDLGPAGLEAAIAWVLASARQPFPRETDSLARAALVRFGAGGEFLLGLTLHHLVCDKLSLRVLGQELAEILRGDPAPAGHETGADRTAPELQFCDYAEWQRSLPADEIERLLFYWKWQLRGGLAPLELPTNRPRLAARSFSAARHVFAWDANLVIGVRRLAARENTDPAVVTLAAFQVLLHRYAGQNEIVIGLTLPCRGQAGMERLVGPVANPVVLRQHLGANLRFDALLAEAAKTLRDAREHQEMPFALLVRALKPAPDPGRTALFDVHFGHDDTPLPVLDCGGGVAAKFIDANIGYGRYDLNLALQAEADGGISGVLVYDAGLYDEWFVAQMMRHFTGVVAAVTADATRPIGRLELLDVAERERVVETWNTTAAKFPAGSCLHELIARQMARTPEAPAVTFEGVTLTCRELDQRANRLANWLRRAGVRPDTLVGVCAERSLELVVALLGVLKAGGAYVPLDPAYPRERLEFMLEDAGVPLLLTQAKFAAQGQRLLSGSGQSQPTVLLLDADWPVVARESIEAPASGVGPDHLAYLIYTSGSTGRPKGAGNTHRAIVNRLQWMQDTYRLTAADVVGQKTPFSFDVSVWEFFWPLLAGARLVVARPGGHQDPAYLAGLFARERVTTLHFVPSMLRVFVEEPGIVHCTALRQVFCSGEALPCDLQERFFARHPAELHNLYGPTEAAVDVSFWHCERGAARSTVPIGRPIANTRLYVLDGRFQPAPIGVVGQLFIGGVALARGYHRRADLTAEKFIPDPFGSSGGRLYQTGDLARWLPDGALEYLGRSDHQVKIRGFRIELGEIDGALARQPGVREAVVVAREAGTDEKTLVAYVVASPSVTLDTAALRHALRATLPEYMVPATFVVLPSLPLTASGKLDRRALPDPATRADGTGADAVAPRTATEEKVAALFAALLHRERVGVNQDFFALGGHSLLATQLLSRVRETLGVELPLRHVFEAPSAAAFAAVVDEHLRAAAPGTASVAPITRVERRPRRPSGAAATTSTL